MEENILEDIKIVDVEESIKTSYLDYSMSVIHVVANKVTPNAYDKLS